MTTDILAVTLRCLLDSIGPAQTLGHLADAVVPGLAHLCIADLLEPPDLLTRHLAVGPDGPLDLPPELGPVGARRSSADTAGLLAQLTLAPSRPLHLTAADFVAMSASDDPRLQKQSALAVHLGLSEMLVLALRGGDQLLGVLVVGRTQGRFDEAAITTLLDLAALTGLALDRWRLLEVQRGVGAALQRSVLPRLPVLPGLAIAARFVPATKALAVGGDWYDSFVLPTGGVAFAVGDATGHDVGAAVRMAELRNLLRALVVDRGDDPAQTLCRLDAVLHQVAPTLSGTCILARLDADRLLRWSSAGHLPPVLLRDGEAALLEGVSADLMLGVDPGTDRQDHERLLRPGDLLLLYTDGLVEHRQTDLDDRLAQLARRTAELGSGNVESLADRLVAELASGEDDVALLVIRVDA